MPFDEKQVMESCATFIKKDCQLDDVQVFHAEDESISFPCDVDILHSHVPDPMNRKKEAKPSKPAYCAYYEEYGCLLQTRLVVVVVVTNTISCGGGSCGAACWRSDSSTGPHPA